MNNLSSFRDLTLALVLPLALVVTLSGCTLLGLGAAAGATVGGCALLDRNQDEQVTQTELSRGIFEAWDANNNGFVSEAEFEAGVEQRDIYSDWSGNFNTWDANNNGRLSETEFQTAVTEDSRTASWVNRRCDDLGL